jgi:hypothetical protein
MATANQKAIDERLNQSETHDSHWKDLYRLGGVAALITVALVPVAIAAHIVWPPPPWAAGAAAEWFARFEQSPLLGLLGLDLLLVITLVLGVPVYLALYGTLRPAHAPAMAVALALALTGTVLHLGSNTAFQMQALSQGYAAATTDAERSVFLAAGEATLASYYGSAFHVSYVLGYAAKFVIGAVMLRSATFGRATAYTGMLTGLVGLGFYLPVIGMFLSILSVVFVAAWHVLVALRLFRLGQAEARPAAQPENVIEIAHWRTSGGKQS